MRLLAKPKLRVVGLMSGTSLDGVDAALVDVEGHGANCRVTVHAFITRPYRAVERDALAALFDGNTAALCQAGFWLGELFAEAALTVIAEAGLSPSEVDLIGSHGQTVWHQPPSASGENQTASTLQIGEAAVIAARTGLVTVADFRVADIAHGGEGAPLVPFADFMLYQQPGKVRALQNIGGIANVTRVGERLQDVLAFDNGPGNMMLDALAPLASAGRAIIDEDGLYSASGKVAPDLLAQLMNDPFLRRPPPKSTGRERYGQATALAFAKANADRAPQDLLATLVAFTAESIAQSYRDFLLPLGPLDEVLLSGGGAHNRSLVAELTARLAPLPVREFNEACSADAKEAVAFALLAVQTLHATPANLPQVTGARRPAVLGKITLP